MKSKKRITDNEIERIKELASSGMNISRIAATINRGRSTVARVLKSNNLTVETLTLEQLNTIRELISKGVAFGTIAKKVHKDKVVLERVLRTQYNINVDYERVYRNRDVWGRQKLTELRKMYMSDKCTVEDIAKHFKCSKSHILKQARIMGIKKTPCINHGIGKIWKKDEQEYVINAVKEQMSHSGKKGVSLLEIAEHINVSVLALVKFLKDNNILCHENGEYIIPSTQEFQDDFKNPFISNRALALKYKMSEASFSKARRQIFGSGWKTKRNTWFYRSTAEIKFEEILSNLHFSFIPQQEINGWRYDYDLGFFLLVEVQGTYWHSTDSVRDNDEKKRLSAEKMGYEVVQIAECDLDNDPGSVQKYIFRKMQDKVKQYYGFPKTL